MNNNCGVYKITNIKNGKVYIGSSNDLRKRLREHFYHLKRGTHYNSYLQRAWNKEGEENFEFSILEFVLDTNILLEREQHYINVYLCYKRDFGYNILPIVGSTKGFEGKHHSENSKKKISLSLMGRKISEERQKALVDSNSLAWYICSPDGEIFIIKNLNNFCKEKGLYHCAMSRISSGKAKLHKGWRCKKAEEYNQLTDEEKQSLFKPIKIKNWIITSPSGETFTVKSLKRFCRENGLCDTRMYNVALGKHSNHKGWTCRKVVGENNDTP